MADTDRSRDTVACRTRHSTTTRFGTHTLRILRTRGTLGRPRPQAPVVGTGPARERVPVPPIARDHEDGEGRLGETGSHSWKPRQTGRASCRERVCQYV